MSRLFNFNIYSYIWTFFLSYSVLYLASGPGCIHLPLFYCLDVFCCISRSVMCKGLWAALTFMNGQIHEYSLIDWQNVRTTFQLRGQFKTPCGGVRVALNMTSSNNKAQRECLWSVWQFLWPQAAGTDKLIKAQIKLKLEHYQQLRPNTATDTYCLTGRARPAENCEREITTLRCSKKKVT